MIFYLLILCSFESATWVIVKKLRFTSSHHSMARIAKAGLGSKLNFHCIPIFSMEWGTPLNVGMSFLYSSVFHSVSDLRLRYFAMEKSVSC